MNCKQGDLAIIVSGWAFRKYFGHVVQCVATDGLFWAIERSLDGHPNYWMVIPDSCLRPIRPGDVTDEEVRDLFAPDRSMKDSPLSDTTSPNKKKEPA